MNYVGIDLHKKSISVCVVDKARKVLTSRRFACADAAKILEFFESLSGFEAVVEATASYEWLFVLLEPLGQRLMLAHPGKMRVIAESASKSDRIDAKVLAEFLALDMIPPAYRPSPRQQELRRLVRHRTELIRQRGQLQTRIRWIVANYNQDHTHMFSVEGRRWLRTLPVSSADGFALEQLLETWEHLTRQAKKVDCQIAEREKKAPPKEKEARRLLQSIPGIGRTIANVFLAEIGEVGRFRSGKRISAYVGLAPARRESAGRSKELSITKRGSRWLRWAMVQGAWKAIQYSTYWNEVFQKLAKRKGRKKAIVALARRILVLMYAVVRDGESYDPLQTKRSVALPAHAIEVTEKPRTAKKSTSRRRAIVKQGI